jgi:hypothetical protein
VRLAVLSRAVLTSASAALAAAALCAAPASADAPAADGCPDMPTVQAFAPWQDLADYALVPDGDIEGGAASWNLDGATAVEGNAPFGLGAATDHLSLQLPASSSATTAPMCLAAEHRTMRFVANGPVASKLTVNAVGTTVGGKEKTVHLSVIDGSGSWAPTPAVEMRLDDLAEKFGATTNVALQFVPRGNDTWQIDDVYVDPYRSH